MTKLECVERECVSSVEPLRSRVEMRLSLVAGQANERVDQSTEVAVEALHFGFVAEAIHARLARMQAVWHEALAC